MEECWPGRPPRDSAREEERRRLLPAGHTRNQMLRVDGRSSRVAKDGGGCPIVFTERSVHQCLCQLQSQLATSHSASTTSCGHFQGRVTESFDGRRSSSESTEYRNGVTVASSLTTSGTRRPGCRTSNGQKGQEKRGTEEGEE